jgi:hypothetical protein
MASWATLLFPLAALVFLKEALWGGIRADQPLWMVLVVIFPTGTEL